MSSKTFGDLGLNVVSNKWYTTVVNNQSIKIKVLVSYQKLGKLKILHISM